ncbi:MAG TPA: hypothetical protein VFE54_07675 [Mucilaginibacter sp.]|nr:hypothetical protein [Mucilaginibacter sp.]
MAYSISNHAANYMDYQPASRNPSALTRFFNWAAREDQSHHIGWVGATVIAMGGVFFPGTMAVIGFNGGSFGLIIAAMIAFVVVVVTNLAALPTKYTIPLFFLAVLADIVVMALSFFVR